MNTKFQIENGSPNVERLVEAANQLSAATTDASVQSDLQNSARSVQQSFDELKHKLS